MIASGRLKTLYHNADISELENSAEFLREAEISELYELKTKLEKISESSELPAQEEKHNKNLELIKMIILLREPFRSLEPQSDPKQKLTTEEKTAIQQYITSTETQSKQLLFYLSTRLQQNTYHHLQTILQTEVHHANQDFDVTALDALVKNLGELSQKIHFFHNKKKKLSAKLESDMEKLGLHRDIDIERNKTFSKTTFDQLVDMKIISRNFNLDKVNDFFVEFKRLSSLIHTAANEKDFQKTKKQLDSLTSGINISLQPAKTEQATKLLSEEKNSCAHSLNESFIQLCAREKKLLENIERLKPPQENENEPLTETSRLIKEAENLSKSILAFIKQLEITIKEKEIRTKIDLLPSHLQEEKKQQLTIQINTTKNLTFLWRQLNLFLTDINEVIAYRETKINPLYTEIIKIITALHGEETSAEKTHHTNILNEYVNPEKPCLISLKEYKNYLTEKLGKKTHKELHPPVATVPTDLPHEEEQKQQTPTDDTPALAATATGWSAALFHHLPPLLKKHVAPTSTAVASTATPKQTGTPTLTKP